MGLHEEVRPPLAMQPGRLARRDAEYRRCGTANVFCGVQPKAGRHFTKVTNDRSSPEFADYLLDIATVYPEADTIHLVLDNLSSHTRKAVLQRFGGEAGDWLWNRSSVHYTPKHGSWLNQAEIAISLFSRQCLGQRRIGDRASLRKETREPPHESRPSHDPVALYSQTSSQEVCLQNYTVTVLGSCRLPVTGEPTRRSRC